MASQAKAVTAAIAIVTRALCQFCGGRILSGRSLAGVARGSWPARPRKSDEFDLLDRVIAIARRRRDLDLVAHRAADQRAPQRGIVADPADAGVRLGLADDLIFDRRFILVEQVDGRSEH